MRMQENERVEENEQLKEKEKQRHECDIAKG